MIDFFIALSDHLSRSNNSSMPKIIYADQSHIKPDELCDNCLVNGTLDLTDCTSLKSLPDNLTINGNLYLPDTIDIESDFTLDNLMVHGNIGYRPSPHQTSQC